MTDHRGVNVMKKRIITIGREFGSNGRIIAEKLADATGLKCYDKSLIKEAAKRSGMWEDVLDNLDEKPSKSFLYNVVMDPYAFMHTVDNQNYGMDLGQRAFLATSDTIRHLADAEPAIFIGRCADYVLRDRDDVLRIFLYAPLEDRVSVVMQRFSLTEKKAKEQIIKEDKARASYYNYYSSGKWGSPESYDVLLNTASFGIEGTVKAIEALLG